MYKSEVWLQTQLKPLVKTCKLCGASVSTVILHLKNHQGLSIWIVQIFQTSEYASNNNNHNSCDKTLFYMYIVKVL